ncbi:hypothetical protein OGAPHI_001454 [Ogataea philodendri]|uniref:Mso1 N-terminal domain-containing protein n=1 Tax=Ogataea philodendri TaxID=1378263 RepID=A0A9P8T7M1_9ASCO|nr:uncharacterized protein OGAPHI_001454 [Ogataea philodendri]KAH3669333.1 hypothetical protein OGAPHI_001454 [Ogataea philodendri]
MFRKFKEFSTDIKTSIRREEKDGKHQDETVVHLTMVKFFRERDMQTPEWLESKQDRIHAQNRLSLDKFQSGIKEANHALVEQVEHIPRITSRFSPQKSAEPTPTQTSNTNGIPQAPLPRRTVTAPNAATKAAHNITSRFSPAPRSQSTSAHGAPRPTNSRFNVRKV